MALITFPCVEANSITMTSTNVSVDSTYFLIGLADASHVNLKLTAVNPPRQLIEYKCAPSFSANQLVFASNNSCIKIPAASMTSVDTVPVTTDIVISKDALQYVSTTDAGTRLYLSAGGEWKIVDTTLDIDALITLLNASGYSFVWAKITPVSINGIPNDNDEKVAINVHAIFQSIPAGANTSIKFKDYTGHVMTLVYPT